MSDPQKEWEDDAEFSILDGNPYYVDGPTYKIKHDIADVLLYGEIPELETDSEKFVFAVELGKFIKRMGINGCEAALAKALEMLGAAHAVALFNELPEEQLERILQNPLFKYFRTAFRWKK